MNYIGQPSIPTASIEEKRRPSLAAKQPVTARTSKTQEDFGLPNIADSQEREGLLSFCCGKRNLQIHTTTTPPV